MGRHGLLAETNAGSEDDAEQERPGAPVTAVFGREEIPELEHQLRDAADGLIAARYPVAAQPWKGLCGDCPGRGGLCPVPPELADRSSPASA
jgi:hypothetical protein